MEACCQDPTNLVEAPLPKGQPLPPQGDLTLRVCAVCNRRHFELEVDPARLGAMGSSL